MEKKTESSHLPDDVKLIEPLELGAVWVIRALCERLGIGKLFGDIGKKDKLKTPYELALLAMVANRLCEPESKLGLWKRRWLEKVWLPDCKELKLRLMYGAMDLFHDHVAEVEKQIFFQMADLMNLQAGGSDLL